MYYRFRSIENLLGEKYQELERQSIYFAKPDQLNDPMEGLRDVFWIGDEIVWRNFFQHYILCLEHTFTLALLSSDTLELGKTDIPVFLSVKDLPTEEYKVAYKEVLGAFFVENVLKLIKALAQRKLPVRRNELLVILSALHPYAILSINKVFVKNGLMKDFLPKEFLKKCEKMVSNNLALANVLHQLESENIEALKVIESVFAIHKNMQMQIKLISAANSAVYPGPNRNSIFVMADFPEAYVSRLEDLVYPDWYTACFMDNCNNSSVWGNYGDNHKGVCLKFRPKQIQGHDAIKLRGVTGVGANGPIHGDSSHFFRKVNYENKHVEIDFFRSIGRLSKDQAISQWYDDGQGGLSDCLKSVDGFSAEWRQSYWDAFYRGITSKLNDWVYEKEYRLVLSGWLHDYRSKEARTLTYRFEDLDGVIFGMQTAFGDKIKIMRIIEEKCRKEGRQDFNFYQAEYASDKGRIEYQKLGLIKFEV